MDYVLTVQDRSAILSIRSKFFGALRRDLLDILLEELATTGCPNVVFDLSEVEFMDSSGIGMLVGATQRLRAAGGDVRLAGMNDRVKTMLHIARLLGPVFDDHPDIAAAQKSFPVLALPA